MTKENLLAVRALLTGWAKWKKNIEITHEYLSPPNLIYRLMSGDVGGGSGFGSVEPLGICQKQQHNPIFYRLDCLIEHLPNRRRETIFCEFLLSCPQKKKAELMSISLKGYERNLNLSLKQILDDDFVKNLVNCA